MFLGKATVGTPSPTPCVSPVCGAPSLTDFFLRIPYMLLGGIPNLRHPERGPSCYLSRFNFMVQVSLFFDYSLTPIRKCS